MSHGTGLKVPSAYNNSTFFHEYASMNQKMSIMIIVIMIRTFVPHTLPHKSGLEENQAVMLKLKTFTNAYINEYPDKDMCQI